MNNLHVNRKTQLEFHRQKMLNIDVDIGETLPWAWLIEDIDTYYHRVGLARHAGDRANLVRRVMIILVNVFVCLRSIVIISPAVELSRELRTLFYYLGDISIIIKLRYHFSCMLITYTIIVLWLIAYHKHLTRTEGIESDIQQLKIAPIELLSGRKRPIDVHLTDGTALAKLAKRAKAAVRFTQTLRRVLQVSVPFGYYSVLMYKYFRDLRGDSLALVTPLVHALVYYYFNDSVFSFLVTSILYFYISVEYLRLKMVHITDKLARFSRCSSEKTKMFGLFKVMREMRQVYCVFREIQDYNTFWSKFNLVVISMFTVNLALFFFVCLFGNIHSMVRLLCVMVIVVEVLIVTTILNFASYVDTLRKRVFGQMFSLRAYFGRHHYTPRQARLLRIFSNKTQLWIETFADSDLGFTLGPFFTINYQVFINIILFVVTASLKLMQIQYGAD